MTTVKLQIPFESLIEAIGSLETREKRQLLEILENQLLEVGKGLTPRQDQLSLTVKELQDLVKANFEDSRVLSEELIQERRAESVNE